jgi:hypothetical protein
LAQGFARTYPIRDDGRDYCHTSCGGRDANHFEREKSVHSSASDAARFFALVVIVSFGGQYLTGPWVFIATIQNSTKPVIADKRTIYAMTEKDSETLLLTQYVFYVSPTAMNPGETLHFPLVEPQKGRTSAQAWVCFAKELKSYSEEPVGSGEGDIRLVPVGAIDTHFCGPAVKKESVLPGLLRIIPSAFAAESVTASYTYTPSDAQGLCNWQSDSPPLKGATLVICDENALTTDKPSPDQLSLYIKVLQNERTDGGTKASVLSKLAALAEDQKSALISSQGFGEACDDETAYPDPSYSEPIALTLFDLARSSDQEIKNLSNKLIEKFNAENLFADFIKRAKPQCRNPWMLRLTSSQAQSIAGLLGKAGLPPAAIDELDSHTADPFRTILRPTATPDGDLYRVEAKLPADDASLKCAAKVYRVVNMQDIKSATPTGTSTSPSQQDEEFALLKSRFLNKSRVVGWYSKIFQRDLLVGLHRCKISAAAI